MFDLIKTLEKNYDYIIFDTPPIGVVIDALPIMKASDGVVIIRYRDAQNVENKIQKDLEDI